ncbi:hypothetical protein F8M41_003667 [Gigaspora margarita]|uniref:Uncharacterized protein n=1 Tax=Gigaspora margarita TaxID=4874 RepID=A0A8H3XCH1_GIGMA|nr:hypothetical protein F8M41_003667 [Gigaspora margarita]
MLIEISLLKNIVQSLINEINKSKSDKFKPLSDPPIENNNTNGINNSDDNINEINNSKFDKSKALNKLPILVKNNDLNTLKETGLSCPIDNIGLCNFDTINTINATHITKYFK